MSKTRPTIGDLKNKLIYCDSVYLHRWSDCCNLVNFMNKHKDKIKADFTSRGDWKSRLNSNANSDELFNIKTWSTYGDCIDLRFSIRDEGLTCNASIYEGDMVYGQRKNIRFKAEIILPMVFIKTIRTEIEDMVQGELSMDYGRFLDSERKKWMKNHYNKLFNVKK